jgi:hypothetical protein
MTRISAFHHRSQILAVNLFISLVIVTTSYNEIMKLYSTQFTKLVRDFWVFEGKVSPVLPLDLDCYYTLSGAMGFLAYNAANEARRRTLTRLQPVIDDLCKQLLLTTP